MFLAPIAGLIGGDIEAYPKVGKHPHPPRDNEPTNGKIKGLNLYK